MLQIRMHSRAINLRSTESIARVYYWITPYSNDTIDIPYWFWYKFTSDTNTWWTSHCRVSEITFPPTIHNVATERNTRMVDMTAHEPSHFLPTVVLLWHMSTSQNHPRTIKVFTHMNKVARQLDGNILKTLQWDHFHKTQPLIPILSQTNPVQALPSYFLRTSSMHSSSMWLLSIRFTNKNSVHFFPIWRTYFRFVNQQKLKFIFL